MRAAIAKPVDYWTLNASGLTSVSSNWSAGVPQKGADVVVAPTAAGVVLTFDAAGYVLDALTLQGAGGVLQGGNLAVKSGATFQAATVLGPHVLFVSGASKVAGLTLGGAVHFDNEGAVTQSGGAVVVGTSKTSRAVIVNLVGATWTVADDSAISQGTGAGGLFVNHGAFVDSAAGGVTHVGASFLSTGAISVAPKGMIEFDGARATLSGSIMGGGTVEYGAADVATLGALAVTATSQTNLGTVDMVGDMTLTGAQSVVNEHLWNFDGDVSLLGGAGAEVFDLPNGEFAKTAGTGVSVVSASVSLYGDVNVATGTLRFTGAQIGFAGPVTGAGTLEIASGAAEFLPTARTQEAISVAHWVLDGGTTTILGVVNDTGAFEGDAGATLTLGGQGSGVLVLSGGADLTGLKIATGGGANSGELILASAAHVSGATFGGAGEIFDQGVVTQSGGGLTLNDSVNLTLGDGGVWNIADGSAINSGQFLAVTIGSAGTAGLLEKTGAGVSVIAPLVLNNATNLVTGAGVQYEGLEAANGTLDMQNRVQGTGSDNIVGDATLEFDAGASAGQTVSFFGSSGSLFIGDMRDFQAGVVGFNASDSIVVAYATQLNSVTETASATVLSLGFGPQSLSLTLTGDYLGDTFSAQAGTIGGPLKITY